MAKKFRLTQSLSVVIPAYNESGNIARVTRDTIREARKISNNFEIVIVNDGSKDNTGQIIENLAKKYKQVRALHNKKNRGLALTWRKGVNAAKGEVILYIEGDGQQPFRDQVGLLKKIQKSDLVLGSRSYRFDYTTFRKSLSYGYLFLIWLLFGLTYKDVGWSQAYRKKIFSKVKMKSVTPFFDTEVVIKAKRFGFVVDQANVPYRSREKGSTSLGNLRTAYSMFKEMLKMRLGMLD